MTRFSDRLVAAVKAKGNPVCVGLDPRFDLLPERLRRLAVRTHGRSSRAVAAAFLEFNRALIDELADLVPACKPQVAFYEEYGAEGMRAFEETVRHARDKGLLVISDAKRGDIGPTAEGYARAHLSHEEDGFAGRGFDADAVTVNPYLGADSLEPFLELGRRHGKGAFVLVRTSNPGARDLQDLDVDGRPLYERVAEMVGRLGGPPSASGFTDVGAVVGATYPDEARSLRALLPEAIFLVPGYGAQGAAAADAAAAFRDDGLGALVNSARGIVFAFREPSYARRFEEKDFAKAARAAAEDMATALNDALRGVKRAG